MDNPSLNSINQVVYQRFPELRGIKPRIQKQEKNTLLTYQAKLALPDERTINRSVRVVISERGEIIKISSSR